MTREKKKLKELKEEIKKEKNQATEEEALPTKEISSAAFSDGTLVEMLYDSEKSETNLAIFSNGEVEIKKVFERNGIAYIPHSPEKGLLKNNVVLFPSGVEEYFSKEQLVEEIKAFIRKYLTVSPFYEDIASYYSLFSWIHDDFSELPYLRALGDYGTGKSRFLKVIGSVCYKPVFTAGATTVSPIFRVLEDFRGTLILDEADFEMSGTTSDMVKILNSGFMKDVPVLRSEANSKKGFDLKSFNVFGPKLIATRSLFGDSALESRMITEDMDLITKREEIATNIPNDLNKEALALRNKLLLFRFREKGKHRLRAELTNKNIESRLNQISLPLMSVVYDQKILDGLKKYFEEYNEKITNDRMLDYKYQLLEAICELMDEGWVYITMSKIAEKINNGMSSNKSKSPKDIAFLVRRVLNLRTKKTREGISVAEESYSKIETLRKRYKITRQDDDVNIVDDVNVPSKDDTAQILPLQL